MKRITTLLAIALIAISLTSCEEDKENYQVRIQNDMKADLLGLDYLKADIVKVNLGSHVIENVPYGTYSDYVVVESATDYTLEIQYDEYQMNDNFIWTKVGSTKTKTLDAASWSTGQTYKKQKIKFVMDWLGMIEVEYYGEE